MKTIWWEKLLSDGILQDNQIYYVKQDVVSKFSPNNIIELYMYSS